jgi:large subunit ribosomal protein L17
MNMRHLRAGRKLGRNATHRVALLRNLARALIEHGRIITTVEKAKSLRPFVEKLITLAKKGLASNEPSKAIHARRLVLARLGPSAKAEFYDAEGDPTDDSALKRLFTDIAPRFADRPGGYTRIIKRPERRLGDGGRTAFIELLRPGETKVRAKAPAPAPRVTPTPAPAPAPTPAPTPPAPEAMQTPAPTPPAAPESSVAPATPPEPSATPPSNPPPT